MADPGFRYLLDMAASGRVWVKLSAAYRNGVGDAGEHAARDAARLLHHAFGVERLLWGSDWPNTQFESSVDYAQTIALLESWLPDAADRHTVLQETPAALFRFA